MVKAGQSKANPLPWWNQAPSGLVTGSGSRQRRMGKQPQAEACRGRVSLLGKQSLLAGRPQAAAYHGCEQH
jgi:hypothetical protein